MAIDLKQASQTRTQQAFRLKEEGEMWIFLNSKTNTLDQYFRNFGEPVNDEAHHVFGKDDAEIEALRETIRNGEVVGWFFNNSGNADATGRAYTNEIVEVHVSRFDENGEKLSPWMVCIPMKFYPWLISNMGGNGLPHILPPQFRHGRAVQPASQPTNKNPMRRPAAPAVRDAVASEEDALIPTI